MASKQGWGPLSFNEIQQRGVPREEFQKLIDHWLLRMEKYQSDLELALRVIKRDPELTVEQIIAGAAVLKMESELQAEIDAVQPPSGEPK